MLPVLSKLTHIIDTSNYWKFKTTLYVQKSRFSFWKTELSITNIYENSSNKLLDKVTFPTQVSKYDEALL